MIKQKLYRSRIRLLEYLSLWEQGNFQKIKTIADKLEYSEMTVCNDMTFLKKINFIASGFEQTITGKRKIRRVTKIGQKFLKELEEKH